MHTVHLLAEVAPSRVHIHIAKLAIRRPDEIVPAGGAVDLLQVVLLQLGRRLRARGVLLGAAAELEVVRHVVLDLCLF